MSFSYDIPVVGILRGFSSPQVSKIVEAAWRGGLRNLEITLNSTGALEQIKMAVDLAGEKIHIGAGTVLNTEGLEQALSAGASFIVTPTANAEVIRECVRRQVPVFPGAFTPTEIVGAWELGASMIKIFPAETHGPRFIKALKGPFPNIQMMPTGGVDLKTLPEFIKAGADGFGVGSPLFERARVEASDWDWIETQCRAFVDAFKSPSQSAV